MERVIKQQPKRASPTTRKPVGRRLGKWGLFTGLFTLIPVAFDMAFLHHIDVPITLATLLEGPSAYLVGFGMSASGLGELMFDYEWDGPPGANWILALAVNTVLLIAGGYYYALNKLDPTVNDTYVAGIYIIAALGTSLSAVIVAAKS